MKKPSKIVKIILNIILWIVIILAALFSILTFATKSDDGVANLGGYSPMTVLSDSMVPTFTKGDLILVKNDFDVSELKEGDIIAFWTIIQNQKVINTHRIYEVVETNGLYQFVTKGDANAREDNILVSEGDIIGTYSTKVPVIGSILTLLSSSIGFLVIIVLPLLIFFLYQLYKLILLMVEMKKEAVKEANESSRAQIEEEIRKKIAEEAAQKAADETLENNANEDK